MTIPTQRSILKTMFTNGLHPFSVLTTTLKSLKSSSTCCRLARIPGALCEHSLVFQKTQYHLKDFCSHSNILGTLGPQFWYLITFLHCCLRCISVVCFLELLILRFCPVLKTKTNQSNNNNSNYAGKTNQIKKKTPPKQQKTKQNSSIIYHIDHHLAMIRIILTNRNLKL